MIRPHLKYLHYVARHKWFVFFAGGITKAPLWRLLIHDWTKFLPSEWFAYVRYFYGCELVPAHGDIRNHGGLSPHEVEAMKASRQVAFNVAWNRHQKRNSHHWQYWLLTEDNCAEDSKRYVIQGHGDGYPSWLADTYDNHRMVTSPCPDFFDTEAKDHDGIHPYEKLRQLRDLLNHQRESIALQMPEKYVREMVADWAGAGKAITGKWYVKAWYDANKHKMQLHPATRKRVEELLPLFNFNK